ncbi:DNA-binding transcriptional regulator, Lrp family [Actinomadura meyerae]|jgi:DNA-binding Lrp family transcriptional regulator|uniref:DNA-binding transcriptional regulator, Lrp family n=1 Tax=Actinomadura meyerae TaxID=240840 RepID=A0A239NWT7_9ACTN|nr:Lrp/AsnC family transcriptional regulator [Actinomadura meyerae]SNT59347.1 DNA-binding transcriptional regulator, Lrp family [Actinomadura meyerae]
MHASAELDELDHLLVTALQTAPRADWRRIGAALGVDASTAARRWARLTASGLAWLTCFPASVDWMTPVVAFIEVDCAPGRLHAVAAELAEDPHVFNLEHVTGGRDLIMTVVLRDNAELARYVGFRVGRLAGVIATRTQLATTLHAEGSRWRLDRLDQSQRDLLVGAPERGTGDWALRPGDEDLVRLLVRDCRLPVARLAEGSGLSPTTVRRRLARLHRGGALVYRCEVARSASGWPVTVYLWATTPPDEVAQVAGKLAGMRETRMCASLSGPHNLLFAVWLRSVEHVQSFEAGLRRRFPRLTVADRAVALWQLKLAGQLLDPRGRHLRTVPFWTWDDPGTEDEQAALVARLRTGERPSPARPGPPAAG